MRPCLALSSLLLLTALACQRLPADDEDDDGGPPPGGDASTTFLPGDDDEEEAADEESGSTAACDPVAQTGCSEGEKCTAILSGGAVVYACVAAPGGLDPNQPCSASPSDGIDGCPAGTACLEDEAGSGLCAALCEADTDCDLGQCVGARETNIPYCADDCSPFASACPTPLACRRNGNRFSCLFLGTSDVGGTGTACTPEGDGGCAPGLVCLPGALVPDCTSDNCCTPLCETTEPGACAAPTTCGPILQGAAPGFEEIGACFVPA